MELSGNIESACEWKHLFFLLSATNLFTDKIFLSAGHAITTLIITLKPLFKDKMYSPSFLENFCFIRSQLAHIQTTFQSGGL